MKRKSVSYYLDQYQQGRCSFDKLVRRIEKSREHSMAESSFPRIMRCFHIYLRPESFRFGFHIFLPVFLLRPVLSIAGGKLAQNNKQPGSIPKPLLKNIVRLLKSKDGKFRIDINSNDGTKIYIKNGKI